jgi:hypothetical protein
MKKSPQHFDRRNFLARSSLWFAALGVAPSIRAELIEKIARKSGLGGGDLLASEVSDGQTQFCIEFVMRAGFPVGSFVCPPVDLNPGRVAACSVADSAAGRLSRRAAIHLPSEVLELNSSGPAPLYLSPYASSLAPLVQDGTLRIAGTQAVMTNGGHSSNFATRNVVGNSGMQLVTTGAPCPAIHFAHVMPKATMLSGVEWKMSDAETYNNAPSGYSPLIRIGGSTDQTSVQGVPLSAQASNFLNLFSPAQIPFSAAEVSLIANASEKLNRNFITYRTINNGDQYVASFKQGTNLLTTDYRNALMPSMSTYTDWQMSESRFGVRLAEAMYLLTTAFSLGLIRTATITINTGDWHGRLSGVDLSNSSANLANNSHAVTVRYLSNALARAYSLAKTLPNPLAPGKSVAEGMVTVMTSEFTRGWTQKDCNDHTDGDTNGFVIIGPTVNNTSASNWDYTSGQTVSIDRATGLLDVDAPRFSTGSAYSTICRSLGIPGPEISRFTGEAPILALLRSSS